MTPETAQVLAATVPASLALLGTVYLARQNRGIRVKVNETHHATTVNHHTSETPTILDRLQELTAATQANTEGLATVQGQMADLDDRLGHHLSWSEDETRNLWQGVTEALRHVLPTMKGTAANVPDQR